MDLSISKLRISERLKRILLSCGLNTVGKLITIENEIEKHIPDIDSASESELKNLIHAHKITGQPYICGHTSDEDGCDQLTVDPIPMVSVRLMNALNRIGIYTLSQLLTVNPDALSREYAVGKKTVEELRTLQEWAGLLPDQKTFEECVFRHTAHPIPTRFLQKPSIEVKTIPSVFGDKRSIAVDTRAAFEELCSYLTPRESKIAQKRIWPKGDIYVTLEMLAEEFGITRERVRQVEKRLLAQFARFFCHHEETKIRKKKIKLKLENSVGKKWKRATAEITSHDEIDAYELFGTLSKNLMLSRLGVLDLYRFSITLYSQDSSSALQREFRRIGVHIAGLRSLPENVLKTSIQKLRLGSITKTLEEKNQIHTLCEIYEHSERLTRTQIKLIDKRLSKLYRSVEKNNEIDWLKFCRLCGFPQCSAAPKGRDFQYNPTAFLNQMRFLVEQLTAWRHSLTVFEERLAKPTGQRVTQQILAERLFGPSSVAPYVARIEKYVICKLATILVCGDFRDCYCHIDQGLLEIFSIAENIRGVTQCFSEFETQINCVFSRMDKGEKGIPHLIWAIFEGNAPNSYHHLTSKGKKTNPERPASLPRKIKLKGFKRIF